MTAALILASGSPRRSELLEALGVRFDVVPSNAPEPLPARVPDEPAAHELVVSLAVAKAKEVARRAPSGTIVLAADTVVVLPDPGTLLGKPGDRAEAAAMMTLLEGREHHVVTGIATIGPGGTLRTASDRSAVAIPALGPAELAGYLDRGTWAGKAGAYGIQDAGTPIAGCEGHVTTVVGLDVLRTAAILRAAGLDAPEARAFEIEGRYSLCNS